MSGGEWTLKSLTTRVLDHVDTSDSEMLDLDFQGFVFTGKTKYVALEARFKRANFKRRPDEDDGVEPQRTIGLARLDQVDYGGRLGEAVWVTHFALASDKPLYDVVLAKLGPLSESPEQILWDSLAAMPAYFDPPSLPLGVLVPGEDTEAIQSFQQRGMEIMMDEGGLVFQEVEGRPYVPMTKIVYEPSILRDSLKSFRK